MGQEGALYGQVYQQGPTGVPLVACPVLGMDGPDPHGDGALYPARGARVGVEFPPCFDDLHYGLYNKGWPVWGQDEMKQRESMQYLLGSVSMVLKEVVAERKIPLVGDKEERLMLRCTNGRQEQRWVAEKVRWL